MQSGVKNRNSAAKRLMLSMFGIDDPWINGNLSSLHVESRNLMIVVYT
jgi:hypothetical protein